MTTIAWFDTTFCTRIVLTFSHFLWQGALISLIAMVLSVVLRKSSARLRYLCFLTSLLLMTICPVVTFWFIQPALAPDDRTVAYESQAVPSVSDDIEVTGTPPNGSESQRVGSFLKSGRPQAASQ